VSNEIGAGNVDKAKNAVSVTMKLSVLLAISFVLFLAFCHNLWASLYSGSAVIMSEFAAIAPLLIVSIVLDSAQGVLSGEIDRAPGHRRLNEVARSLGSDGND
jgi:MATE family multidrug resistance protein